jgi:predicted AAA+ superfamily ATPase
VQRTEYIELLKKRFFEKRKFIQVVAGPRQVGKTTLIQQFLESFPNQIINASGDDISPDQSNSFISGLWDRARLMLKSGSKEVLIVIDETQKITGWSETVKKYWDDDTRLKNNIKVLLSGSPRLLIQKGLTESLAGRYELIPVPHWSYSEMKEAFGWTLDQYIYFGAYPGAAELIEDEKRWRTYIKDSIIIPSITKDILFMTKVDKPALLQQLFELGSFYSAQTVSFTSMLGQLNDAGNTTTLASYLELLEQAGLLAGLQKYSGSLLHTKGSSPKYQVFNNALMTAQYTLSFEDAKKDPALWGRLVESSCGSHIVRLQQSFDYESYYWREKNDEMDFVIKSGANLAAVEIKSRSRFTNSGIAAFRKKYPKGKTYVVSYQDDPSGLAIPMEQFLKTKPDLLCSK